ncbi:MAG: CCC motif membrane protein [Bacteroidota bacterium]
MENTNITTNQPQVFGNMQALPNATAVLVLGIISIATCWCYGIIGVACGIIALVLGGKAKKLYIDNPGVYSESSYKNMKAGHICGIIGTVLSSLYLVFIIIYLMVVGAALSSMPWDMYNF